MVWGGNREPLDVLEEWVDQQIANLRRPGAGDASTGGLIAYENTKRKIAEVRRDA